MKPTATDIAAAIARAEKGGWIDPCEVPLNWLCELYDPEGRRVGNGNGVTAPEAMAMAWLHVWAPDALIDTRVEPGSVPLEVPAGWYFELALQSYDGREIPPSSEF